MSGLYAFEVSVKRTEWSAVVNARSRGQAKRLYRLSVTDAWPDVPFTAMRCRKVGPPITDKGFERVASYRGMPALKCGQRVRVGKGIGVVVGYNSSANFDVLFDDDSPAYPGLRLNVHPGSLVILEESKP